MATTQLVLLHLSDIHLKKEELESGQDLDQDIRRKLLEDLLSEDVPIDSGVDAILITGDVGYKGHAVEYESAHKWLKHLCRSLGCEPDRVWVVPGNHDSDRSVTHRSQALQDVHQAIRNSNDPAAALTRRLQDVGTCEMLLQPFQAYNAFARSFSSETSAGAIAWESEELELNDGTRLVLRGLNSALISDRHDDGGRPCAVLGLKQVQLDDTAERTYVTLGHHPPDWLYDGDLVDEHLTARARIQLWGHKHRARVRQVEQSLVMAAGALHPDRNEGDWEPRYNLLHVSVSTTDSKRTLDVAVYQREWKREDTRFGRSVGKQAEYPRNFSLLLPDRAQPPPRSNRAT